jgi:hypothetical protein
MRLLYILNNGEWIETGPAFLFDAMVWEESLQRSDKTWQGDTAGWSNDFLRRCAELCGEIVEYEGDRPPALPRTWKDDLRALGRVGGGEVSYLHGIPVALQVYYGYYAASDGSVWWRDTAYWSLPWRIVDNDGTVVFACDGPAHQQDDWKIIHRLSGQETRRDMRVRLSSKLRSAMIGSHVGYRLPPVESAAHPGLLPLRDRLFEPSRRGDDWVVAGFRRAVGKVIISPTNISGYYEVVHETERVRFVELVMDACGESGRASALPVEL